MLAIEFTRLDCFSRIIRIVELNPLVELSLGTAIGGPMTASSSSCARAFGCVYFLRGTAATNRWSPLGCSSWVPKGHPTVQPYATLLITFTGFVIHPSILYYKQELILNLSHLFVVLNWLLLMHTSERS